MLGVYLNKLILVKLMLGDCGRTCISLHGTFKSRTISGNDWISLLLITPFLNRQTKLHCDMSPHIPLGDIVHLLSVNILLNLNKYVIF